MSLICDTLEDFIKKLSFFQDIGNTECDLLLKEAIIKNYSKRATLFLQGDKSCKFLIIIKGWVKLYNLSEEGQEVVVGLLSQGDVIGDITCFDNSPHSFAAVVVEDSQLLEIPADVMRERVFTNAKLAAAMVSIITKNLHSLRIENGHLTTMSAPQRLSCLILRLSAYMVGKGGTFNLPYDKSIMAAQLGMDPATLSRVFTKLEEYGVTNQGAEVIIRDFSALSEGCCRQCPVPEGECQGRKYSDFDEENKLNKAS